jgi:hypothetical protein
MIKKLVLMAALISFMASAHFAVARDASREELLRVSKEQQTQLKKEADKQKEAEAKTKADDQKGSTR